MKELEIQSKKMDIDPRLTENFMSDKEHTSKWILIDSKFLYDEEVPAEKRFPLETEDVVLLKEHVGHKDHVSERINVESIRIIPLENSLEKIVTGMVDPTKKEVQLKIDISGPIKLSLGGGADNECTVSKVELTDGRRKVEAHPFASNNEFSVPRARPEYPIPAESEGC